MKFSTYLHIKTKKILADFQICISVPLKWRRIFLQFLTHTSPIFIRSNVEGQKVWTGSEEGKGKNKIFKEKAILMRCYCDLYNNQFVAIQFTMGELWANYWTVERSRIQVNSRGNLLRVILSRKRPFLGEAGWTPTLLYRERQPQLPFNIFAKSNSIIPSFAEFITFMFWFVSHVKPF